VGGTKVDVGIAVSSSTGVADCGIGVDVSGNGVAVGCGTDVGVGYGVGLLIGSAFPPQPTNSITAAVRRSSGMSLGRIIMMVSLLNNLLFKVA